MSIILASTRLILFARLRDASRFAHLSLQYFCQGVDAMNSRPQRMSGFPGRAAIHVRFLGFLLRLSMPLFMLDCELYS